MKKEIIKKAVLMIVVEILFLILLGGLLFRMQTDRSIDNQKQSAHVKLEEAADVIGQADDAEKTTVKSFDEIQQAKVASMAFMFRNGVMEDYSEASMQECRELLDAENALILDVEGNVLAEAQTTASDFTKARFNQLRTVFESGVASEGFTVETERGDFRYYGYMIDDNTMAVLEKDSSELEDLLETTSTWEAMLKNITVGLDGFSFAVSAKDYTFLYYPNEALIGMDALSNGIAVTDLEDGNYTWMTINSQRLYCGVKKTEEAYVFCAVPEDEILSSRDVTVLIILFTFFTVMTLVVTYALFITIQEKKDDRKKLFGNFYYNYDVGKRIGMVVAIGLVCILIVSFYMQTLFAMSQQSMSNNQRVAEIEREIKSYEEEKGTVTEQYNERYLNKAQIAAYILTKRPDLAERETLAEMSTILGVEAINVFDENGVQTATNSPYTKFQISDDPESQSYEFRKLLMGVEYLVQEAQPNDVSGEYEQYVGVTLRDQEGNADGFVQICVEPSTLEGILANMQLNKILSGIKVGNNGIVFAINKEQRTFSYYPIAKLMGKKVSEYGIKKAQLTDGYTGYLTISNNKYYASSLEIGGDYVYAAVPAETVGGNRLPLTVASGIASLAALIIIFMFLTFSRKAPEVQREDTKSKETDQSKGAGNGSSMVDVIMPDKRIKRTKSAASRWQNNIIEWDEKTPEQQIFVVLKTLLAVLAFIICISVLMKDTFFDSNSIFCFVLDGQWAHGFNIFAVTSSLMIICVVSVITMIAQKLLTLMARTFGAKGETVCRLLHNFLKYISVIGMLYYCLSLFGVDTATLLASAGILSLVIGLGAQTLVSDILAGLFIIFEGEFQVGDIVTIGDWRGTVVEIGIRTTKILDGSGNIKIISNSDVCGVINMTREYSYSWVDVGIEYGESLERVESILEDEFPNIRSHIPQIMDGPFYKGVVSLGDNSVNIRIMVLCAEGDRIQMERDLNREIKLIFDKHSINIPFPQVVVNQPSQFQAATAWEKMKSERFAKNQREAAGSLIEDDEDER